MTDKILKYDIIGNTGEINTSWYQPEWARCQELYQKARDVAIKLGIEVTNFPKRIR